MPRTAVRLAAALLVIGLAVSACGTVKMGDDPATSPLDPFCRSFDHQNLFVVDGSFLPTSAAVNPALTVAALALRAAEHVRLEISA